MALPYKQQLALWQSPGAWAHARHQGRWAKGTGSGRWAKGTGSGRWSTPAHHGSWSGLGGIKLSQNTALLAVGLGVGLYLLLKK